MVLEKTKRRWRNSPTSTGAELQVQPRDLWGIFRPIYEHGALPTPYLLPFAEKFSPSYDGLKMRLTDLYHEENTEHGGRYLRRLGEHKDLPNFTRFAIYDVTQHAEHALEEAGYSPSKRSYELDFDTHRFMISCTGASLEIAVNETEGLTWEARASIVSESPTKQLRIPCTIAANGYSSTYGLMPDDLFGINYDDKYWRLFAVECDRGNEPYERANLDETSLHAKFLRYQKVIGGGTYKAHFGRKCGMLVLFVFNTSSKERGFLERVERWNGGPCPWILTKTIPCFGKNVSIPPVMRELLTTSWKRAGYPDIDISKPN